ncbi:MAG: hypothetical protein MI920_39095 [Kiloniellales bacterium]|nr:hypothetical protein [Kiloniellales bacterium]
MTSLPAARPKQIAWRDRVWLALQSAVVAVVTSVVAGVLVYEFTQTRPNLELVIYRPDAIAKDRLSQAVVIRNTGEEALTGIQIVVLSYRDRRASSDFDTMPPRDNACEKKLTKNGALSLDCGKLQPNGLIHLVLEYRRPPFSHDDIEAFADNARSKKTTFTRPPTGLRG